MYPLWADALAAVPFLPQGKGALILILGGLAVLPASLLWSRASTGTQRWVTGIEQGASRLGLGPCKVVSADLRSCIVLLTACPSCRGHTRKGAPCTREQHALEAAVASRAPGASAVEVSCNTGGRGSCTFVVHRGRSP
ncbi:MAG: hypothetical protein ACYC2H_09835 [Thermoplasmatota archaeon]